MASGGSQSLVNNIGVDAEADAGAVNAKCHQMQQGGMYVSLGKQSYLSTSLLSFKFCMVMCYVSFTF
jgi:hypothetical protein